MTGCARDSFYQFRDLYKKGGDLALAIAEPAWGLTRASNELKRRGRKARVDFVAADMPNANQLTVRLMAVIAQEEREMIAARTKAALAASKAGGVKLGGWRGGPVVDGKRGIAAVQEAADSFARRVGPMMLEMRERGLSLDAIAAELQTRGVMTARGRKWTATTVRNVFARLG